MGAILKNGYTFDVEYSVMLQKGAIHVYKGNDFIEEMSFDFDGMEPDPQKIEFLIETFCNNKS